MTCINDPDVLRLVELTKTLRSDYLRNEREDPWARSPFAWIRTLPSRQRGKVGEQLIAGLCAENGIDVTICPDSQADLIIAQQRVEIKFSTLWESGIYKFQQLRNQNYEFAVCLGISPFDAHCWVLPKSALYQHVIGHTPQHAGREGTDTYWLSFPAASPPQWIKQFGGRLDEALAIFRTWQAPRGRYS